MSRNNITRSVTLSLAFVVSSCGHNSSPISPSTSDPPVLSSLVQPMVSSPPTGSTVSTGSTFNITVNTQSQPPQDAVIMTIAFVRDDGMDFLIEACSVTVGGGYGSIGFDGRVDPSNSPVWASGHTVSSELIAMAGAAADVQKLTHPCVLNIIGADNRPTGRVNWSAVQYRSPPIAVWNVE